MDLRTRGGPLYSLRSVFPAEPPPPPTEPLVRRRDELLEEGRRAEAALARARERLERESAKAEGGGARVSSLQLRAGQLRSQLALELEAMQLQQQGLSELRARLRQLEGRAPERAQLGPLIRTKAWIPAGRPPEQLSAMIAVLSRGADVELVGTSQARLRHSQGAEALVDLRAGRLLRWASASGRVARAGDVTSLKLVQPEAGSTTLWRLTRMDDSNNEPSITLTASGTHGEAAWRAARTLSLGASTFSERLVLENLSSNAVLAVSLREDQPRSTGETGTAPLGIAPLRVQKEGAALRPPQQLLPPLSSCAATQHWRTLES